MSSKVCPLCSYHAFTADAMRHHQKFGICKDRQERARLAAAGTHHQQSRFT